MLYIGSLTLHAVVPTQSAYSNSYDIHPDTRKHYNNVFSFSSSPSFLFYYYYYYYYFNVKGINIFVKEGVIAVGAPSDLTCHETWCIISWTISGDNVILT